MGGSDFELYHLHPDAADIQNSVALEKRESGDWGQPDRNCLLACVQTSRMGQSDRRGGSLFRRFSYSQRCNQGSHQRDVVALVVVDLRVHNYSGQRLRLGHHNFFLYPAGIRCPGARRRGHSLFEAPQGTLSRPAASGWLTREARAASRFASLSKLRIDLLREPRSRRTILKHLPIW